ncbi:HK-domain-containing protein [Metschnikowia bicuspidata]|uniref:hydroxyethylthiazole kinase n=1 Tax=Metschnikowia bicuspidata TaxID=27322 RepID=A0A4P9Z980_9ASCO|nr:HK-domain-containing protein [Metschnikowia bicuspidata]
MAENAAQASRQLVKPINAPSLFEIGAIQSFSASDYPFQQKPIVHHITNNVVKNFCANVTLALGASPIMSEYAPEFDELAGLALPSSLVVNLGMPSEAKMAVFLAGLRAYNSAKKPILFDPVAAGVTS